MERTDERTNERTNERANERTNERRKEQTKGRTKERTNEWTNGLKDGREDGCRHACMRACIYVRIYSKHLWVGIWRSLLLGQRLLNGNEVSNRACVTSQGRLCNPSQANKRADNSNNIPSSKNNSKFNGNSGPISSQAYKSFYIACWRRKVQFIWILGFTNLDMKYYTSKVLADCTLSDNLNKLSTCQTEQYITKHIFLVHKQLTTFRFFDFENWLPIFRVGRLLYINKWVNNLYFYRFFIIWSITYFVLRLYPGVLVALLRWPLQTCLSYGICLFK